MNQDNAFPQNNPMGILSTPLEKELLRKVANSSSQKDSPGFESIGSYIASSNTGKTKTATKSGAKNTWLTILLIAILGFAGLLLYWQQNPKTLNLLTEKLKQSVSKVQQESSGIFNASTMNVASLGNTQQSTAPTVSEGISTNLQNPIQPQEKLNTTDLTQETPKISVLSQFPPSTETESQQATNPSTPLVLKPKEITAPAQVIAPVQPAPSTSSIPTISNQITLEEIAEKIREIQASASALSVQVQVLANASGQTSSINIAPIASASAQTDEIAKITQQINEVSGKIQALTNQAQQLALIESASSTLTTPATTTPWLIIEVMPSSATTTATTTP